MKKWIFLIFMSAILPLTAGCGPKQPVIYPEEGRGEAGEEQIRQDVSDCLRRAKEAGAGAGKAEAVAKSTAVGAGAGAAVGAAVGAVGGRAGAGAARGAAGGGAAGLIHGLLRAQDLTPVEKRFVEECLRRKGYTTVGWR